MLKGPCGGSNHKQRYRATFLWAGPRLVCISWTRTRMWMHLAQRQHDAHSCRWFHTIPLMDSWWPAKKHTNAAEKAWNIASQCKHQCKQYRLENIQENGFTIFFRRKVKGSPRTAFWWERVDVNNKSLCSQEISTGYLKVKLNKTKTIKCLPAWWPFIWDLNAGFYMRMYCQLT